MTTLTAIEKLQRHTAKIRNGKHRVKPGQPIRFPEAAAHGDFIRQGDLYLILIENTTSFAGYSVVESPRDIDRQLVPGNTTGAKHCLDSLKGVTLLRPVEWTGETLQGPLLRLSQERVVMHPTHGAVTLLAGTTILCHYQRELDQELRKERRARD